MAVEQELFDFNLQAAADYQTTSKKYYFMSIDANGRADLSSAADADLIGVLQNKPKQYQAAQIRRVGISKVMCGGTIAVAAKVTPDSAGKAVEAAATERYGGIALEAGVSGRIISILMEFGYMPA